MSDDGEMARLIQLVGTTVVGGVQRTGWRSTVSRSTTCTVCTVVGSGGRRGRGHEAFE